MSAIIQYELLIEYLSINYDAIPSQMFGKKCIKVNNKAIIALYNDSLVFKLPNKERNEALSLTDSTLWDPSQKNRPMKEWVQVSITHHEFFKKFAITAADYINKI